MLKIRFNNQTHRLLKTPPDLKDLLSKVRQLFGETLPPYWTLDYPDIDDDYVVLDTEEEYKLFLQLLPQYTKAPTIYVQPRSKPVALQESYSVLENILDSKNQQQNTLPSSELILREEPQPQELDSSSLSELSCQSDLVKNQQESIEEGAEVGPQPSVEEFESQLSPKDSVMKMDSSKNESKEGGFREGLEKLYQAVRKEAIWANKEEEEKELRQAVRRRMLAGKGSKAKEEEISNFNEKVIGVIFKQLPLIVSHVEKRLEEKKLFDRQASMSSIHEVQCSGCQRYPIIGTRYQSIVCQDFNFCEQCEENQDHMHPFAKLKRRGQQDFLPQSLNSSQFNASIYPRKEPAKDLHQVYQAGSNYPPSLIPSIGVTKSIMVKDFEGKQIDEKKDVLSSKVMSEDFMETSQKVPQKKVTKETFSKGKTKETAKVGSGKDANQQSQSLEEQELTKIEEKVKMLREVFGGERETLVRFVRENKDLEMDLLCEKYLILDLN